MMPGAGDGPRKYFYCNGNIEISGVEVVWFDMMEKSTVFTAPARDSATLRERAPFVSITGQSQICKRK